MSLLMEEKASGRIEDATGRVEPGFDTMTVGGAARLPEAAALSRQPNMAKPRFALLPFLKQGTLVAALLMGTAFALEHLGPPNTRPSTILGAFGGKVETAQLLEQLDAHRAVFSMQQEEQARATQESERFRALHERVTRAYEAEYQRGQILVHAGAQAAQELLRANTMAKMQAMEGNMWEANTAHKIGAICSFFEILSGSNSQCSTAAYNHSATKRAEMEAEIVGSFRREQAGLVADMQSWAQGLLTPAAFIAQMQQSPELIAKARPPVPVSPTRTGL